MLVSDKNRCCELQVLFFSLSGLNLSSIIDVYHIYIFIYLFIFIHIHILLYLNYSLAYTPSELDPEIMCDQSDVWS